MNEDNNKSGQSSFAWEAFIWSMIKSFITLVLIITFYIYTADWLGLDDPRKRCNYRLGDRAHYLDLKTEAMWIQEEVDEFNEYCKCFHNYKDAGVLKEVAREKCMESK